MESKDVEIEAIENEQSEKSETQENTNYEQGKNINQYKIKNKTEETQTNLPFKAPKHKRGNGGTRKQFNNNSVNYMSEEQKFKFEMELMRREEEQIYYRQLETKSPCTNTQLIVEFSRFGKVGNDIITAKKGNNRFISYIPFTTVEGWKKSANYIGSLGVVDSKDELIPKEEILDWFRLILEIPQYSPLAQEDIRNAILETVPSHRLDSIKFPDDTEKVTITIYLKNLDDFLSLIRVGTFTTKRFKIMIRVINYLIGIRSAKAARFEIKNIPKAYPPNIALEVIKRYSDQKQVKTDLIHFVAKNEKDGDQCCMLVEGRENIRYFTNNKTITTATSGVWNITPNTNYRDNYNTSNLNINKNERDSEYQNSMWSKPKYNKYINILLIY